MGSLFGAIRAVSCQRDEIPRVVVRFLTNWLVVGVQSMAGLNLPLRIVEEEYLKCPVLEGLSITCILGE